MKRHYYLQGGFVVLTSLLILSTVCVYGAEESIVLTTYYPSPYGVYGEMRLYPKASAICNGTQRGLMYYDDAEDRFKFCAGTPADWQGLGGYWVASTFNSNNIYNTNSGNVGIGMQGRDPIEPLQVRQGAGGGSLGVNIGSFAGSSAVRLRAIRDNSGDTGGILFTTHNGASGDVDAVWMAPDGRVGIGTTKPFGKLEIAQTVNVVADTNPNLTLTQYSDLGIATGGGAPKLHFRRARGTSTAPGPVWLDDALGSFVYRGYAGPGCTDCDSNNFSRGARISANAAENWSASAHGTYLAFEVASAGTSSLVEAMRITPSGTVGIGTGNVDPAERLTILGTSNGNGGPRVSIRTSAGVTEGPKLRLFHQGEVGGRLWSIRSAGSADPGSGATGNFDIYDATAGISRLIITPGGNVGINTLSPSAKLTVTGDGANSNFRIYDTSGILRLNFGGAYALNLAGSTGANNAFIPTDGTSNTYFATLGGKVGIGTANPQAALDVQTATPGLKVGATCVSGSCPSDIRLKQDIAPIGGSLQTIASLKPMSFRFRDRADEGIGYGFIAQDVQKVAPEWVRENEDGYLSVDYSPLMMMLVDSVKELKAENDALKARLDEVERKLK